MTPAAVSRAAGGIGRAAARARAEAGDRTLAVSTAR
jgi:NAD(P)-dependent dehydrogenase (short-subunit alcohol dehydrogenase family)